MVRRGVLSKVASADSFIVRPLATKVAWEGGVLDFEIPILQKKDISDLC